MGFTFAAINRLAKNLPAEQRDAFEREAKRIVNLVYGSAVASVRPPALVRESRSFGGRGCRCRGGRGQSRRL